MSNDSNRTLIVIVAAAMIVLMALLIFVTWSANTDAIDSLGDLVEFLNDHNDSAGRLIITLAALIVVVLSLLIIVVELAPEDEEKELRVKQEGATTIVPASALRARIEEALVALPEVTAARAKVSARDKGIATSLNLTVTPGANIAEVTQESARVVTDTVQTDLGLPLAGVPDVRVAFGGPKQPVAPSVAQPPEPASDPGPTATDSMASGAAEPPAAPDRPPAPPSWAQTDPPAPSADEFPSGGGDTPDGSNQP